MSKERAAQILTEDNVQGVPELIMEITSSITRTRDETVKHRLYESVGVSEY
jgi:Uma2 family endonuclease